MSRSLRRLFAILLCATLLTVTRPARAQTFGAIETEFVVGLVVAGAAIGIGVYLALHHHPTIKGCATSGPDGLQLVSESDQLTFMLQGNTGTIAPGERVRLSGKKKNQGGKHMFMVQELPRDLGPCKTAAARP